MQASEPSRRPGRRVRMACISTWLPRRCGIAVFSADLARAVRAADPDIEMDVAAIDSSTIACRYGPEVRWRARQGHPTSYAALADEISSSDVDLVSLQHEFGLYGIWGEVFEDHLASFLEKLDRPLVATLHTVLPAPTQSVRAAVRRLAAHSAALVVMTQRARGMLDAVYDVDVAKVHVVPHGAPQVERGDHMRFRLRLGIDHTLVISTFGLLDRRKGVHVMVEAMRTVVDERPDALYLVIGVTHPEVAASQQEAYREELVALARRLGLQRHVQFVDRFLTPRQVVDHPLASDIYVTPYLDPDQACSGTLAYALGTGKAIVSTGYPHAQEALAAGRGLLVDFGDPAQLAASVLEIAASPERQRELEHRAYEYGCATCWPLIGRRMSALYRTVASGGRGSARHAAAPPSARP